MICGYVAAREGSHVQYSGQSPLLLAWFRLWNLVYNTLMASGVLLPSVVDSRCPRFSPHDVRFSRSATTQGRISRDSIQSRNQTDAVIATSSAPLAPVTHRLAAPPLASLVSRSLVVV